MPTPTISDLIAAPLLDLQASVLVATGRRCRLAITLERDTFELLALHLGAKMPDVETGKIEMHPGITIKRGALVIVGSALEMR